jgi:endonuclease III
LTHNQRVAGSSPAGPTFLKKPCISTLQGFLFGIIMNRTILSVAEILESHFGTPVQRKKRTDPVSMLVGTILSQNTNDKNSHQAYLQLRRKLPRWNDVAEAPLPAIASAIRPGGLKNIKSRRIKNLLREIKDQTGSYSFGNLRGKSDEDLMKMLLSFEGVGYKTAACVLLFSLRRGVFPVDTHIHRIMNRLGIVATPTADKTFEKLKLKIPPDKSYSFHVNLIRFGRTVCRAQRPRCRECPLFDVCQFPDKNKFSVRKKISSHRSDFGFMVLDEIH